MRVEDREVRDRKALGFRKKLHECNAEDDEQERETKSIFLFNFKLKIELVLLIFIFFLTNRRKQKQKTVVKISASPRTMASSSGPATLDPFLVQSQHDLSL